MDALAESGAALVISGADLQPDAVSRELGAAPHLAEARGEERRLPGGGRRRAETGRWERRAPLHRPGDPEAQIAALLAGLSSEAAVWRDLATRFTVELRLALYLDGPTEAASLSAETTEMLAARGIDLRLEIYAPFTAANSCGG